MNQQAIEEILDKNLKFMPEMGKIELLKNRMLMFNHASVRSLRTTTIEQVGEKTAQVIFAKFGYESAIHDYHSLDRLFVNIQGEDKLAIGPIMHGWCGLVKVIPEFLELDRKNKKFAFRGRWINSYEALAHLDSFGPSSTPVCFSLTGYGSAWCSQFFGMDLLEIETKCVACGDPYCEWEIRPWDAWGPEADPWKQSLTGTDRKIIAELFNQQREIDTMKLHMDKMIAEKMAQNTLHLKALCHDIKTPLQVALSSLKETLISGDIRPTRHAAWSLKQAEGVVERFHQANHNKTDQITTTRKPAFIRAPVSEAISLIKDRLAQKEITIENHIEHGLFSYTDPIILRDHVILNILTNAVKFSPLRSMISISAIQIAPGQTEIKIVDQGIGIPTSILNKLGGSEHFEPQCGTLSEKGSGQGLKLANFFTQKLGGSLEIKSQACSEDPAHCGTSVTIKI
ncbi:MAG: XylR N-terminal domain-containing protein [bacterium]